MIILYNLNYSFFLKIRFYIETWKRKSEKDRQEVRHVMKEKRDREIDKNIDRYFEYTVESERERYCKMCVV